MIKISSAKLSLSIVVILAASIIISSAFGYWQTSSTKQPVKIKTGEFAGLPNPSDIRGSYSWADTAKAFNIPVESLLKAFNITESATRLGDLETIYAGTLPEGIELGTDSVRVFVALYTGLPHTPEETTVIPAAAIPILLAEGKADKALIQAVKTTDFTASTTSTGSSAAAATESSATTAAASTEAHNPNPSSTGTGSGTGTGTGTGAGASATQTASGFSFTGKTSFYDLKTWGYDMKKVEEIMGGLGQSAQSIKDYCAQKGLVYSEIKTKLAEIDPKK